MKLYKLKRMRECWASDGSTKNIHLEGAERMRAKREVAEGLEDFIDCNGLQLRAEIQWEEEQAKANQCYLRELADPNYKCTCFDYDYEDYE